MNTLYRTTGFVLSKRDYKEVDRWYILYTKEFGKKSVLARGGHKPLAKLTPHLEMVAQTDFLLVNGRAYPTVAGVERRKTYPSIYTDVSKITLAQNALSLVDIGTRESEPDEKIFDLLDVYLEELQEMPELSSRRASLLLGSFTLKLMSLIGYQPELDQCLQCRIVITPKQYKWHSLKGGVVCIPCTKKQDDQWFSAREISDESIKLLRFARKGTFEDQLKPTLSHDQLSQFHEALESLIINHFPTIPANSLAHSCSLIDACST